MAGATTWPTAPVSPPAWPHGDLYSADPSNGAINLVWQDKGTNETSYGVERSTKNRRGAGVIASLPANSTSYSDSGLTPGATYYYRVRCFNGPSAPRIRARSPSWRRRLRPPSPGAQHAKAVSGSQITLTWRDKAINETGYSIERSTDNKNWAVVATVPANSTSYSDAGLSPSTRY